MPLVQNDYYTSSEALALIRGRLPDEDAERNLVDALKAEEVRACIVDPSGRLIQISGHYWRSRDGSFRYQLANDMAEIQERLVSRPAPYSTKRFGTWNRDGRYYPNYIQGALLIERDGLDTLLDKAATIRPVITVGQQTRCQCWLVKLMRDGQPTTPKADYRAEAKKKFGVGTKAFDRAWANAIEETGNTDWSKSGPRPKSNCES